MEKKAGQQEEGRAFRHRLQRCQTTMEIKWRGCAVWMPDEAVSRKDGTEGWRTMTRRWGITLELLTLSSQRRRILGSSLRKPGYPGDKERQEVDEQPLLEPPATSSCYPWGLFSSLRVHPLAVLLQHHVVLGRHLGHCPWRPLWPLIHLGFPPTAAFIVMVIVIVVIGASPNPALVGSGTFWRSFLIAILIVACVAIPTPARAISRVVWRFWGEEI